MNINISGEVVRTSQLPKRIIGLGDYLVALNSSPLETSTVLVSDFVSFLNTQFATSLASLTDVSINGPLPGQALVFNGSYWVNQNLVSSLAGLSDVTIASLNPNQLLRYDGTSWKNWTPTFYSLPAGGTTLQYIDGTGALQTFPTSLPTSTVRHQVKAGVPITKGQAVYVTSADGTNMIVGLASNASEATSSKTMGLLDATVSTNGFANVVTEGLLTGLDTTGANAAGDPVWLGTNGNLIYGLVNKPYAPDHLVFIGIVTRRNANNGEIFVKVQNGFELQELHNVDALNPSNNDGIFYNSTTQLWEHKQISAVAPTPTLDQVTTAGNTTTNDITVGKTTVIHTPSNGDYIFRAESTQNRLELIHPGGGGATLQMTSTLNSGYTKEFIMTGKFKISTEYFGNAVYFGNSSTTYTIFTNTNNFAIGTTTDSGYKLDVNGTLRATGIIYADSTIDQPTNFGNKLLFMGSGNYSKIALADGTNWSLDYHSGTSVGNVGYHRFYTGSTSGWVERMRIDNSGNVGIGTTSPTDKLQVAGNVKFGTGAVGTLFFWDNVNGRLGIGNTTPSYKLEVNGGAFFNENIIIANGDGIKFWVDKVRIAPATIDSLGFYTGTTAGSPLEQMRIVSNGNVLIGTSTDAGYKLDVNGSARVQGNSLIKGSDDTNQNFALQITNLSGTTKFQVGNGSQNVRFDQWQPLGGGSSVSWTPGGGISLGVGSNTSNQTYTGITYGGGQSGSSTTGSYISLNLTPAINQTGASGATTRGIYINPTLTSAYDFRAIETVRGNVVFGSTSGNVLIGTTTDVGYKLDVNGTTRVTSLYTANIYPVSSTVSIWVNSQNSGSRFYFSPVHPDGRINFNAVAGTNDYTLLRTWHDSNQIGLGTGSSAGGGALTTRGDSVLIGTSGALYFMNGTFGPNNVPFRLAISTNATRTSFYSGVENNLTNIESTAFEFTAKSHTFFTGTTAGNQTYPNQFTPLHLSTGGNVIVGGTTDAGYKLDVNGTARISGQLDIAPGVSILQITAVTQVNSRIIQFNTNGSAGAYSGGYEFRSGFNSGYGANTALRIWSNSTTNSRVGIGNLSEGDLQGGGSHLYINNSISGGRNAGIRISPTAAATSQYNGIQFDYANKDSNGGAFLGSQHNPLTNGYDMDLVVLTTSTAPNSYAETARFIGKYNSFFIGTDKTLAQVSAKLQVESTTQGFLAPRLTTAQILLIASPAEGLQVYNTDLKTICFYNGTAWQRVTSTAM